jgi:hypothetical protein
MPLKSEPLCLELLLKLALGDGNEGKNPSNIGFSLLSSKGLGNIGAVGTTLTLISASRAK